MTDVDDAIERANDPAFHADRARDVRLLAAEVKRLRAERHELAVLVDEIAVERGQLRAQRAVIWQEGYDACDDDGPLSRDRMRHNPYGQANR